jgi:perosamine synthetase
MIPRYGPTYTYGDLFRCLVRRTRDGAEDALAARLAEMYGVNHVFLFDSARAGLYALLRAYGRPGKVLMPAYNCIVVPEAVAYAGYEPALADIDYDTLNVTAHNLRRAMSPDVTVVFATHVFGIPCEIEEIAAEARRYGALVVEDAAPALGAEYRARLAGTFGDASVVSFQSTKVISGETGGALLTNDDELAQGVARVAREAGPPAAAWPLFIKAFARKMIFSPLLYPLAHMAYRVLRAERMYEVVAPQRECPTGFFGRCAPFSCALVLAQMDRLGWNLGRRRRLAEIYQKRLPGQAGLDLPSFPAGSCPAWIQFPILAGDKQAFYEYMQRNHVDLSWTFRYSCADSYELEGFPATQRAARTVLGLPTYPSLADEGAHYICDVAHQYAASQKGARHGNQRTFPV